MATGTVTYAWSQGASQDEFCGWQRTVDEVCDRFEDAWKAGESPRVEDSLASCKLPPTRLPALLCELLKLERELRQGNGEQPLASEYLERFPDHAGVVRALFGEARLGAYELIGLIGEGGMGSVYRAFDPTMLRTVALKVIRSSRLDDSSAQIRFRLEAQLAARLDHEHIVPVFEAGQDGSQLFYTMRLIQGRNLSEVIDRRPLENRQAAHYIEQVARAVDYAHGQGILHRDLKPSNILIDAFDRAFVTDFGLAKMLGDGTGATGSTDRLGTLAYMAPEQARNPARAIIESDVYSLGATLYEAITGRPPFQADSVVATLELLEKHDPVSPRRTNPAVHRDLETICLKCLEKDPRRRYASATALADDLRRYRNSEPIEARRVGPLERARMWVRRNPTVAALIAVLALLLASVLAVVQARRITGRLAVALAASELGYRKALDSVEEIARFAERRLGDRPDDLKELLGIVQSEYVDYLTRRGDNPRFARESAAVLTRMARIMNAFGSRSDALRNHERALQLRATLARNAPADLDLQAELAETWHDLGNLSGPLGKPTEAIEAYRRALAIRQSLVRQAPRSRSFWNDLARSHGYIGDWEREHGLLEDARGSYDKALRIRERLSLEDRSNLAATFQLARSDNNNGHLEREAGDLARPGERHNHLLKALEWHRKAVALQRMLVAQDPAEAQRQLEAETRVVIRPRDFRADLASSLNALGILLTELGRIPEAEAELAGALALFEQLAKDFPGLPQYRGDLAWTATELGVLRGSAEDLRRAGDIFRLLVRASPRETRFLAGVARNKSARGELALRSAAGPAEGRKLLREALEDQRRLVRENPDKFDYRFDTMRTEKALSR